MSELDFIYKRKSIRDFKDVPVPKEDILKMLEAATFAPSPKHQQNWHFVVVQDQEKIKQMADAVTASHTAIANMMETEEEQKKYMKFLPYYTAFARGPVAVVVYSKPYDMIEEKVLCANNVSEEVLEVLRSPQSAAQGIGAAVENFLLAAANMGYGTCYMTGPAHAKREIEEVIGFDKPEYSLMSIIALGVPQDETPKQPKRKPLEDVVTFL